MGKRCGHLAKDDIQKGIVYCSVKEASLKRLNIQLYDILEMAKIDKKRFVVAGDEGRDE